MFYSYNHIEHFEEPSEAEKQKMMDDMKKEDAKQMQALLKSGVTPVTEPQFQTMTVDTPAADPDLVISAINDPTIPGSNSENTYQVYKDNPDSIIYLDNDIYYTSNSMKKKMISKKSTVSGISLIFILSFNIFLFILGFKTLKEFWKYPRQRWNLVFVYIIIIILVKINFNYDKKFLFFNKVNSIDSLFSKNLFPWFFGK
jgi:hypothetical protein